MKRTGWIGLVAAAAWALMFASAVDAATQLPAGWYLGRGRLSGGFSGNGVNVKITHSGLFAFCLLVEPSGTVSPKSKWSIGPTNLSETLPHATGHGTFDGGGVLSGNASVPHPKITLSGNQTLAITISIPGAPSVTVPYSFSVGNHKLQIAKMTATGFKGDVAFQSRRAQGASGFNSNERGYYTATKVASCTVPSVPKIS
ncbi:MAG: hypothetical protein ACYC0H_06890 [Solirubrobacteraceae bacterium]